MGKENKSRATNKITSGVLVVRDNVVRVAGAPGRLINRSKEAANARRDAIYESSSVVAISYVDQLKTEFPEATNADLIKYMNDQVLESASSIKNADLLVDNLTLYVCVALELSGGSNLDVETKRQCVKLIETTRNSNKARKLWNKVETATRIAAAIAALLPDKGKMAPIKKLGQDVSIGLAAKDQLQSQLVDTFENNGVKNPGQQAVANRVISATSKILASSKASASSELGDKE